MKKSTTILIALLVISCFSKKHNTIENVILNNTLVNHLDAMITKNDSLEKLSSTNSNHYSYWIFFREENEVCYVHLMANFSYYNRKEMIGSLNYRNKIITFYNETKCNNGFIDTSSLKNKIEELKSLDDYNTISIPPHEPQIITFKIAKDGTLIKLKSK